MRLPLLLALAGCTPSPPPELWLGGDLYYGDRDPAALLAPIAPLTGGAVGVVNLEGAVPGDGSATYATTSDGYRLHNAAAGLPALRRVGIVAVGIENNHAADGEPADTRGLVSAAGLAPLGDATVRVGGTDVSVVQVDLADGVPAGLGERLAAARRGGEGLVVGFHVTGPPSFLPRAELRAAVELAVGAGASVIVSHGTHALGPVERRGGAVIAWGLGNLAMACDCTDVTDAMLLRVRLGAGGIDEARVYPIRAGLRGEPARPAPDAPALLDLLTAIGSPALSPRGGWAVVGG